ncbi:MAG: hypothetical protein R3B52_03275 [Candidatus Paceibacterota bacterium]
MKFPFGQNIENSTVKEKMLHAVLITAILAFLLGWIFGIGNQKPRFSELGLPLNCRAKIEESLRRFHYDLFDAEKTLLSLEWGCGANGVLWANR